MSYNCLSIKERLGIEIYYKLGYSMRKIEKYLYRRHSTIVRELKRLQEYSSNNLLIPYNEFELNSK